MDMGGRVGRGEEYVRHSCRLIQHPPSALALAVDT